MRIKGFTLVELAIVIVIIGLLVGGVLQGQELIQQAKINSTVSKVQSYNAAVNTFRAKYNALPGDITKPGEYGLNTAKGNSVANTCYVPGGGAVTATSGGAGNGSNIIGVTTVVNCGDTTGGTQVETGIVSTFRAQGEVTNFFVHMSNAQLVKEGFSQAIRPISGVPHNPQVGTALPALSVGTGMIILNEGGSTFWTVGTSPNITTYADAIGNTLTPQEAYAIDGKLDDGNPTTGIVQAVSTYNNSAFTLATPGASTCIFTGGTSYNFTGSNADTELCTIRIKSNF